MPTLAKHEQWKTRAFDGHLRKHAHTPFAWGTHDCCIGAANAILANTGTDIADDFRGKYSTEAEAFALIKTVTGGTTVGDAAAHCALSVGAFFT